MPMTFAKEPKAREKINSTNSMRKESSDEEVTGKNNDDSSKPSDLVATTSANALPNSKKKIKLRRSDSIDRDYTISENEGKSSRLVAQDVSVGILSDVANVVEKNVRTTYGHLRSCKSKRGSMSSSSMELRTSKVRQKSRVALHRLQNIAEDFTMSLRDDSRENPNDEIPKQRTFPQKNWLFSFLADMKTSLTKLLGDVEQAQKTYFPNNEAMEPVDVHKNSDKNSEVALSDVNTEDCNAPLELVEAFVEEEDVASGTEDAAVAEADSTSVEKSAEESASSDFESDATVLNLSPHRKKSGEETSKNREAIRSEKQRDVSSGVESDATVLNLSPRRKKSGEEKSKNRQKIGGEKPREKSSNVKSAATVLCLSPRRKNSGEEKSKDRQKIRGEKRRYSWSDSESVATMLYLSPPRMTTGEERSKNREKIRAEQRRDSSSDVESVATVLRFDPLRKKSDQPADQSCSSHDNVSNDNDSGGSFDLSDVDVARAREAILVPNREDSSAKHRSRTPSSDPKESNDSPLISSDSDSKSERSSKSPERYLMGEESEKQEKSSYSEMPRKKRSKFRSKKNRFYIADEKMKMNCEVRLVRLRDSVLERYSRGSRKSRKYVESEEIQRHVALDNKKAASSSSEDEDSSKLLTRNKRNTRAKEPLMNHLKKVNNGENIVESSESDDETSKSEKKNKAEEFGDYNLFEEANRMARKRMFDSSASGTEKQPDTMKKMKKVVTKEKLSVSLEGEEQTRKAEKTEKGRWRKSKILTLWISSSDSDEECQKFDTLQDKLANKKKHQGFYMFHSVTQFHKNAIASAALFLSAKVGEQPRTLEQVINGGWMLLHRNHTPPQTTSTQYLELLEDLVLHENVLLKTLGFDLIVDHPHFYIVRYSHLVKASKDHVKASYFMASNSLHLTTMCLLYKPTVVACFCIHITSEWSNWEIQQSTDGKPWFWHIDSSVTEQQLRQFTAEFFHIFDKCSTRLKQKITSKLGNQSSSINKNSPYLPIDVHSRQKQSCTNDGSTFRSSSVFSSNDPKKPSVSFSNSSFRTLDDYHEKPEKKECERSKREKAGAVDVAPNTSAMSDVVPPQKSNRSHSHHAKQQASSSQPSSSLGKRPSGSGTKPKMHHDHRKAHRIASKPEALSLHSQRHSSSTSPSAQESDLSRMSCDHSEANPVNLARCTLTNHHGSQSKKARITISAESKISVSSVEDALNIEKFYRIPEKHEKAERKSYHPRNKNVDNFGKDSMQKECKKYQQQHHCSISNIDATAHNPTKPTIRTNIRDEPSSTIGRSGSSSVANKTKHSEPMKALEPEPFGRQTSLTNALKISKHEDLLSVATPDSGFGTQPTTSFQDCLSPIKTARQVSALSQEPLVSMPSFFLGIPEFGAPETSSQQSRHRDELSSYKNLRASRYSQIEHLDGISVSFATASRTIEEKRVLPNNHEASGSSTTTAAEATSRWQNFDNCKSKKKKKDKKHKSEMPKNILNVGSISNVGSQVQPRSQDKVSSQTLTGLAMKMPTKRLRETTSDPIQGSLKMEIRTLGDDTSSSTTRTCASSSSRNSDRSRTGSDASAVTRSSTKKLRVRN